MCTLPFADLLIGFFIGEEDSVFFSVRDDQLAVLVETVEVFAGIHDLKILPEWFNRSHVWLLSGNFGIEIPRGVLPWGSECSLMDGCFILSGSTQSRQQIRSGVHFVPNN